MGYLADAVQTKVITAGVDGTAEKEKDFFIQIFRRLVVDPSRPILGILEDTCNFFGVYGGFVYEADHAGVFHLCEIYPAEGKLRENFTLEGSLDKAEIASMFKQTGGIVYLNSRKNRLGRKFLELFNARTLVMIPVFVNGAPAAFVGLMDRRRPVRLSTKEIDDADAVLSVLAEHIQTRVYQKRLELTYGTLKNMVDKTGVDIYVIDYYTNEVLFVNESLAESCGGSGKVLGKSCWEVFFPGSSGPCSWCPRDKLDNGLEKHYGWDFQRPSDGSWFRVIDAVFSWVDGRLAHVVSRINITESKKNEELVKKLAETDSLTGLPNRRKFMEDFKVSLALAREKGGTGCLLFMDLDDFKAVNDTCGHLAGDGLLWEIGSFLRHEAAEYGRAYRYGGDEFVIIIEGKSKNELGQFGDLLLSRFDAGWESDEKNLRCGVSIGAVQYPAGEADIKELIRAADETMYEVKRSGKHGFRLGGLTGNRQ